MTDIATSTPDPARPCCGLASRPDAADLDAALRGGAGVREVARRFQVGRTAVSDHRGHLGLRADGGGGQPAGHQSGQGTGQGADSGGGADTPADTSAEGVEQGAATPQGDAGAVAGPAEGDGGGVREGVSADTHDTSQPLVNTGKGLARARVVRTSPPRVSNEAADTRAVRQRIETVAGLVADGMWRGWATVEMLAGRWGCSRGEVEQLHRLAARQVAQARGGIAAQRESSVGFITRVRDEEDAAATKLNADADALLVKMAAEKDWTEQQLLSRLAHAERAHAGVRRKVSIEAAKHLDSLLFKQDPEVVLRLEFSHEPQFMKGFGLVSRILDRLAPGASAMLGECIAAYEDHGEAGLEQAIADRLALQAVAEDVPEGVAAPGEQGGSGG